MSLADDYQELEHQVEKGNLFAHTVLTEQILRFNESESFIYGLIDYLIQKGIVQSDELKAVVESVRQEIIEKEELATLGVSIRVDSEEDEQQTTVVNCEERLPICKAVCCRLRFALSVEEIETGKMKWELGKPYYNRHHQHGYCHQMDLEKKCCQIYENRPSVCRKYSCANDKRIWKDFEKMELNEEWIDENLNREEFGLVEVFMD
ncbi:MAG: YkgJ family cysteine cluster protein [Spirulinaceae cyanobacterium]